MRDTYNVKRIAYNVLRITHFPTLISVPKRCM